MALGVQVESLENRFRHQIEIWDPAYEADWGLLWGGKSP
jgi:hypothetical protein